MVSLFPDTDIVRNAALGTTASYAFSKEQSQTEGSGRSTTCRVRSTLTANGAKDDPVTTLRPNAGTHINTSCIKMCHCIFPYLSKFFGSVAFSSMPVFPALYFWAFGFSSGSAPEPVPASPAGEHLK